MVKQRLETIPSAATLQGIEVFSRLQAADRESLAQSMRVREYAPKQIVLSRKEPSKDVYFVLSGTVKATFYSAAGKEVTFQELGSGDMFGELSAIDGEARGNHVETRTPATIAWLPEQAFWTMLGDYPEVRAAILRRLTGLVRYLCEKIIDITILRVKDRVCIELVRLARATSDENQNVLIAKPPTHEQIAANVGSDRVTVTKVIKRLDNDGLIDWRPGHHSISDVYALEKRGRQLLQEDVSKG